MKLLTILQLYPAEMNIYGDWGNVLTLKKRAQQHGFDARVATYEPGQQFSSDVDIIVGGGGQDSGQYKVQDDLLIIGPQLRALAQAGTPMLMICGLYQLFGHYFKTSDGGQIEGIGLFDAHTVAGPTRLIGNIVTNTPLGQIVGYENHSGQTFLHEGAQPFGKVVKGAGNNGQDDTEGARLHNVYGSYLHGSLLPKNPVLADELIKAAATKRYGSFTPSVIDDTLAAKARRVARDRPR
jgi:CobQ-like glutamine amidotransferase family enzyme